jgi:anti-sigma28 factor (negative regulator of flagellin synthesis)
MTIHKIGSDMIRPSPLRDAVSRERKAGHESTERAQQRADSVGFSEEGLALAEQARSLEHSLSPERLEQIESRIASGYYDDPSVAYEVARRLLASGDLDSLT